ncbi:MAG: FKBP-type peptidyl-prolyl cis-trans isomerase [Spirochaetales bacterium]|nr:FKBP-type peptidyl-prolyl cis-trans isomerase [Spirochaetales bacterium]
MKFRLNVAAIVVLAFFLTQTGCRSGKVEPVSTEGYSATPSGLQYKVEKEGAGRSPIAWDTVTVHYEGKLMDGRVFDSSYDRKEPSTFRLSKVIKGWTEGVQLMKEGAIYHFIIPPELAYGDQSAGSLIAPNSTLKFKVELLKVW